MNSSPAFNGIRIDNVEGGSGNKFISYPSKDKAEAVLSAFRMYAETEFPQGVEIKESNYTSKDEKRFGFYLSRRGWEIFDKQSRGAILNSYITACMPINFVGRPVSEEKGLERWKGLGQVRQSTPIERAFSKLTEDDKAVICACFPHLDPQCKEEMVRHSVVLQDKLVFLPILYDKLFDFLSEKDAKMIYLRGYNNQELSLKRLANRKIAFCVVGNYGARKQIEFDSASAYYLLNGKQFIGPEEHALLVLLFCQLEAVLFSLDPKKAKAASRQVYQSLMGMFDRLEFLHKDSSFQLADRLQSWNGSQVGFSGQFGNLPICTSLSKEGFISYQIGDLYNPYTSPQDSTFNCEIGFEGKETLLAIEKHSGRGKFGETASCKLIFSRSSDSNKELRVHLNKNSSHGDAFYGYQHSEATAYTVSLNDDEQWIIKEARKDKKHMDWLFLGAFAAETGEHLGEVWVLASNQKEVPSFRVREDLDYIMQALFSATAILSSPFTIAYQGQISIQDMDMDQAGKRKRNHLNLAPVLFNGKGLVNWEYFTQLARCNQGEVQRIYSPIHMNTHTEKPEGQSTFSQISCAIRDGNTAETIKAIEQSKNKS